MATVEDRFWAKVDTSGECWMWTGAASRGYGYIRFEGRNQLAHRVSYRMAYGDIPHGLDVCHRCDIGLCVNPAHLFAGTASDNMRDRNAKGRAASRKGPLNGRWKGGISHGYRSRNPSHESA